MKRRFSSRIFCNRIECDTRGKKLPKICLGHVAMAITGIVLVYMQWMQ